MQATQTAQVTRNQATLQTGAQTTAKQISTGLNNPTRYPVWAARLPLQASLKINAPGDRYEQEADRVADQVMCMPASQVQRKTCSCGKPAGPDGKCEECKRKKLGIQRMASGDAPQTSAPPIVHQILQQPGRPLDTPTRNFMESRFGRDFGDVRLHTGKQATASAEAINARAYTVGQHIVFGRGRHASGAAANTRLLAHELTHVVQQRGGVRTPVVQRAETDTSQNCAALQDSKDDVNKRVNKALSNARTAAGKPVSASKVIDKVAGELAANTSVGRSAIEDWASTLGATKVDLPAQSATKYKGVNYMIWRQTSFPILNPTMKVNGICIGSDKLGHFFQQGFDYFKIARRTSGGTVAAAEEFGERTEGGGFGLTTTGVFSNADLEANRRGLRFYDDLAANASLTFDIANYINANWNEETNPSFYESSVAAQVWSNLLTDKWSGAFATGGASSTSITVDLAATTSGAVTGSYEYSSGGAVVKGAIKNGKITYLTTAVKGKNLIDMDVAKRPVSGVKIEFEWSEGANSGKGEWTSANESRLTGTWGRGSSASNGGSWDMDR